MNNFLIGFLTVVVIVIAAWLAGWRPIWLPNWVPTSPLREGFEAPPTVADPMRPTEAETLAYLKYAVQKATKPLDFSETEALMDRAFASVADDKSTLGWHKQWLGMRNYFREVYNPQLISRNLVEHPFYKAVMEAQSADELMKKIIAAKGLVTPRNSSFVDDLEAMYDFIAALDVKQSDNFHPTNNNLTTFIERELYHPLEVVARTICESGKAQYVFGSSADAVCQAAMNVYPLMAALTPYYSIYKEARTVTSVGDYIVYINLYVKSGHTNDLYRIPPWYRPPKK